MWDAPDPDTSLPCGDKGPPLGVPRRRVLSGPEDEFDPHHEACFPVMFDETDRGEVPSWEPLSMKLLKELKQACALYRATAPYTITLVVALVVRWMTPHDRKTVAKACLSGGQYILWRTECEDLAPKQADANHRYGPRHIVKEMLVGTGEFGTLGDQMGLDKRALEQVTACAIGAWRLLPQGKESTSSFQTLNKNQKSHMRTLCHDLWREFTVISSNEAANILIKQLAFENANSTCQAILRPIKNLGK